MDLVQLDWQAAQQLNKAGHSVDVYERDSKIGGLLRYGIPDFKMEKNIIDRRLSILEKEGINFFTNKEVGKNYSVKNLKNTIQLYFVVEQRLKETCQ